MMYNNDFKLSTKYANANRALIEAMINNYEEANKPERKGAYRPANSENNSFVLERMSVETDKRDRYARFVENVNNTCVTEAIYHLFEQCIPEEKQDVTTRAIMRAMTSQYVHENGYDTILSRMRAGSSYLSSVYRTITETVTSILECIDKNDSGTFVVTDKMKDNFYNALNYNDSESISDAIKNRVNDAMTEFIDKNKEEHDSIEDALNQAKEQIAAANPDEPDSEETKELQESYSIVAKKKISKIRNAPKGVLHTMISTMCETVLKNSSEYCEFMNEGKLDVGKVIDRVSIMYTFMEMINTAKIDKVDSVFIEGVINDLKA